MNTVHISLSSEDSHRQLLPFQYTFKESAAFSFFFSNSDQTLQRLKERRDMIVLLFASHRSILLLKSVWGSLTACQPLSPPCLANEEATAPAGTRDFLLFPQHTNTKNKRTLHDILSHCCSRPTDAPRALFVYVLPPLSLFLYLSRLSSTSANCFLACVCVSTCLTLDQRVYVEVWVCSTGHSRAVLFCYSRSFLACLLEKTTKAQSVSLRGTSSSLSLSPVPFLCQSVPSPALGSVQARWQQCWGSSSSAQQIRAAEK